jgi:hypothetical protein
MSACENIDGQCSDSWGNCDEKRKEQRSLAAQSGSETACETCIMLQEESRLLADTLRMALWLAHKGKKDRSEEWLDEHRYDSRLKMCEALLCATGKWKE